MPFKPHYSVNLLTIESLCNSDPCWLGISTLSHAFVFAFQPEFDLKHNKVKEIVSNIMELLNLEHAHEHHQEGTPGTSGRGESEMACSQFVVEILNDFCH